MIEIHDYKTSARMPSQARLDEDRQLALYQMALSERYDGKPMRLVWHYLRQGVTRVSTRTREQLDTLGSETRTLIDDIEQTTEFPARTGALCRWCEYNDRCDAFGTPTREIPAASGGIAAMARASGRRPASDEGQLGLPLAGTPPQPA